MDTSSPRPAAPSLAALLGGIMHDAKDLLGQELTLAKLEGQDELRQLKTAALVLGIGAGVSTIGGLLLSLMLAHGLAVYTGMALWGCYGIVGSVLTVIGWMLIALSKHKGEAINFMPQTVETMKENAQWLREQTSSDAILRTPVRP